MAEISPAQSPSPAAPTHSSPQMTAADSETVPLLSQDPAPAEASTSSADPEADLTAAPLLSRDLAPAEASTSNADSEANASPNASRAPPLRKHIIILTSLSLAHSLISLTFLAATYIFMTEGPVFVYFSYPVEQKVVIVLPITIIAAVLSLTNLIWLRRSKVFLPLTVNIIPDIIIFFFNSTASIVALAWTTPSGGISCGLTTSRDECDKKGRIMQILMGITMGMALGVGNSHSALFILRCIEVYRIRFWRRGNRQSKRWFPTSWRFPTGTIKIEFTMNVMRQEREGQIRI